MIPSLVLNAVFIYSPFLKFSIMQDLSISKYFLYKYKETFSLPPNTGILHQYLVHQLQIVVNRHSKEFENSPIKKKKQSHNSKYKKKFQPN